MTQPNGGEVQPYSGQVVTPSRITSADDNHAHRFFNVIRDLLHGKAYHNEADVTDALDAVSKYEASVLNTQPRHLVSEDDPAPREDVSQRTPPPGQNVQVVPAAAPQLDYGKLAAAIVAHQQAQQAPQDEQAAEPPASKD